MTSERIAIQDDGQFIVVAMPTIDQRERQRIDDMLAAGWSCIVQRRPVSLGGMVLVQSYENQYQAFNDMERHREHFERQKVFYPLQVLTSNNPEYGFRK